MNIEKYFEYEIGVWSMEKFQSFLARVSPLFFCVAPSISFWKKKNKKMFHSVLLVLFFPVFLLAISSLFQVAFLFLFIFFWLRWFSFVFGSFLFCVPFPPDVNQWNTRGSLRLTRLHPPFFGFNGYFSMRGRRFSFVPVNASRVGGLEIIPELFDCSGVARWMENGLNQWNIHRWFDLTNSGAVRGGLKFRDSSSHSAERMD